VFAEKRSGAGADRAELAVVFVPVVFDVHAVSIGLRRFPRWRFRWFRRAVSAGCAAAGIDGRVLDATDRAPEVVAGCRWPRAFLHGGLARESGGSRQRWRPSAAESGSDRGYLARLERSISSPELVYVP
jgi:hypothetical protein